MANTHNTTKPTDTPGLIFEPKLDDLENILAGVYDLYHLIATIGGDLSGLDRIAHADILRSRLDRILALVEVARCSTRTLHNGIARAIDESIEAEHADKERAAA